MWRRRYEIEAVGEFARQLDHRHQVVVEPVENCYWFMSQLGPDVGGVHVANPGRVRLIAESRLKNDRIDAHILADLLRVRYLPEVHIPSDEVQRWRRLVSHRVVMVRDRARYKHRLRGLIGREGFRVRARDILGRSGRAALASLPLPAEVRVMVDRQVDLADRITEQLQPIDAEIERIGRSDEVVCRLTTIDGISWFMGLAIRCTVDRMDRFKSYKAFAAYTGLVPSYRQSGETTHTGGITKQGSRLLRWTLLQAVPHACHRNEYLRRMYARLCYRSSRGRARVAVAHALARIIYHVWTERRDYYR
jgi:transposase